ncbi:troponin c-like protein, putative [Plasmodium malariae]|uniref:Troponin c-like protein, putative n=1 Tax=Plasmodium malariae TaxID=5858 RepID=A0A1D3SP23_PLAMA|nr:troponin c-like protein, putative [Plasmodium malariae]SCO93113.1 troponin c-like protein, putative [Plasmodium malariae]
MEELTHEVELTSLFNKISEGSKTINSKSAMEIIYKMGYVPSKEDIDGFIHDTSGICSLSSIIKFCKKLKTSKCSTEGLIDLFMNYDLDKSGKISKEKFKLLFTTVGSKLSNKEIDIIIGELCDNEQLIDYKEFLNKLLLQ